MASITWTNVTDHAPELTDTVIGLNAQADILAWVNVNFTVKYFGGESGPRLKMARIYLAAHVGTLARRKGVGGPVTSRTLGPMSQSFGAMTSDPSWLVSTAYGQLLKGLINTSSARGPHVA